MSEIKVHVIPCMGRQGDVLIMPSLKPFDEKDLGAPLIEDKAGVAERERSISPIHKKRRWCWPTVPAITTALELET